MLIHKLMDNRIHLFRFRPNIVFEGGGPFAEDKWEEIRIGSPDGPTITLVSKCARCLVSGDVEAMNIAQDIECLLNSFPTSILRLE